MKTIKVVTDKDEALEIANKAIDLIVNRKDNSPVVTGADPSYIRTFIVVYINQLDIISMFCTIYIKNW